MTDGTTATGTTHIITVASTADGMTRGTGEAAGDGTTLGTVLITARTTADGTEDGILTGDITTITDTDRDTSEALNTTETYGMVQGIRPDPSVYSEAVHHSEAESEAGVQSAETAPPAEVQPAAPRHPDEYLPEDRLQTGMSHPVRHQLSAEPPW